MKKITVALLLSALFSLVSADHLGFWNQDRLRTTSIAGILDVNMDFLPTKK